MTDAPDNPSGPSLAARPAIRAALFLAGTALLAGAVWFALRDADSAASAWRHARSAPLAWTLALLAAPLLSWLLTSAMFALLTRRFARVPMPEMLALIGASWLLNYLPLRPGLLGRVAYLRAVHGVPIVDSVRVSLLAGACTVAATIIALAAWAASRHAPGAGWIGVGLLFIAPAGAGAVLAAVARRRSPALADLAAAVALRTLDMGVTAGRLWLAFMLIGRPIDPPTAAFLAGPSQVVGLLPIHLGTVEWAVGLLSAATADGVTAAVVNRAADLLVSLVVGAWSIPMLARLRRRRIARS